MNWLTPKRFIVLFAAIWIVLIGLALAYWSLTPIALGVLAWFAPKVWGWVR